MLIWIIPMTFAAFFWAAHIALVKMAVVKIPPELLVFLFYIIALITTFFVLMINRTKIDLTPIFQDRKLLVWIVGAGVTIGLVDFFFSKGLSISSPPPLALYSPLFTAIGLSVAALIGVLVFQEALSPLRLAGFVMCIIGIFLLAR
jgi:multidrug transporter EmrE-like cation transporter